MKGRIILLVLLLALITACFFLFRMHSRINLLEGKLDAIRIYDFRGDSVHVENGFVVSDTTAFMTLDYVKRFSTYRSPFGDSLGYDELITRYVHNRADDLYGARRTSGDLQRIHEGIDLFVPENTPVYPINAIGIVTDVSDDSEHLVMTQGRKPDSTVDTVSVAYGKIVRILYPEGIESIYAHLNAVFVSKGQLVYGNTKVGITGFTGNIKASGKPSHLHLELRHSGDRSFEPVGRLMNTWTDYSRFITMLPHAKPAQVVVTPPPTEVQNPPKQDKKN